MVDGLGIVDSKLSLYYIELQELFERAATAKNEDLKALQRAIDDVFTSTFINKYKNDSGRYYEGLNKYFDCFKKHNILLDVNVSDIAVIMLKEFLKVLQSLDGIEELTFRSIIVKQLVKNYPKIEEIRLHEWVMVMISTIIMDCNWWQLKLIKEKHKNVSYLVPNKEAFKLLKGEFQ
jgi:plasmid replication initiation protein